MKKKFIAFGMSLLATFALASCGEEAKTTTAETTTEAVETTTETTTKAIEYVHHDANEPTYDSKGNKEYYTVDGEKQYYDKDKNPVDVSSLLIDYLTLEGEIVSIDENGNAITNITAEDFHSAYGFEYLLTTKFADAEGVDIPFVKWTEELADGDAAITADGKVMFTGAGINFAEKYSVAAGTKFTMKYNDEKLYTSKIAALNYIYEDGPVSVNGKEISVEYVSGSEETYLAKGQAVLDAIEAATVTDEELIALYDDFGDTYYYLVDQYRFAKIISDRDNTEESYDIADEIEALTNDFAEYDEKIDIAAYNSKYKEYYYLQYDEYKNEDGTLNEEAVKEYVDGLNPETTATLNEYSETMSAALSDYYSGTLNGYEALLKYLRAAKAYATTSGYDDYLTLAYDDFGREYTVEDTDTLAEYIDKYIIPVNAAALDGFYEFRAYAEENGGRANNEDWQGLVSLVNDFYGNYFEYVADYAENVVGDEMGENFKTYFTSGNYWYSATENDNVTGYVWNFTDGSPLMFLGPNNQELGTFIHEFGHYNEGITAAESDFYSMDLNEVHSQANEMLFYKYLTTTDAVTKRASEEYLNYMVYTMTNSVVEGYLINEIEKWLYTYDVDNSTPKKFEKALLEAWEAVCTEAGLTDYIQYTDWLQVVLLNYQGYYISYSTSALAALQVYAQSTTDYETAVTNYKKLYQPHAETDTFTSVLVDSGFKSIFDEDAFKAIATACGVTIEEEATA